MSNNVSLGQSTNIILPIDYMAIKSSIRKGNDLVITLVNGKVFILEDYFVISRKLVTNGTQGAIVQELTVSDEGAIVGVRQYAMEQVEEQFGNKTTELDFQTSDVLLFSTPSFTDYSDTLIFGSTALLSGLYWYSIENDKGDALPSTSSLYDSSGKVIKTLFDTDQNGQFDRSESYSWNGDQLTTVSYDNNNDSVIDMTVSYSYNSDGKISSESVDADNDSVIDSKITYNYENNSLQSISLDIYNTTYIENFTAWTEQRLNNISGIHTIQLNDPAASTQINLDDKVVAKLLNGQESLTILGDTSDTVTLDNFVKAESSSLTGFEQYTAVVDNSTYTAFIDSDVNVILA